jgi:hypothetical protein
VRRGPGTESATGTQPFFCADPVETSSKSGGLPGTRTRNLAIMSRVLYR